MKVHDGRSENGLRKDPPVVSSEISFSKPINPAVSTSEINDSVITAKSPLNDDGVDFSKKNSSLGGSDIKQSNGMNGDDEFIPIIRNTPSAMVSGFLRPVEENGLSIHYTLENTFGLFSKILFFLISIPLLLSRLVWTVLDRMTMVMAGVAGIVVSLLSDFVIFSVNAAIFFAIGIVSVFFFMDRDLPSFDELLSYRPPEINYLIGPDGNVIRRFGESNRIFVPIEQIPPLVKNAFISAEDKNFYTHPGVDFLAVARAMLANFRSFQGGGGFVQGGSTIVQQVIKNFLVGNERSFERKIKEAILAVRIGDSLSKDRILEIYLNEIFLGQNSYGVLAASERYFGKSLEELDPQEAAYLAALPKAPSGLHPVRNMDLAIERRNYVLNRMAEDGHISASDLSFFTSLPLKTILSGGGSDFAAPIADSMTPPDHPSWGYWMDEAVRMTKSEMAPGALDRGGWRIFTTINPEMQNIAHKALSDTLSGWGKTSGVYSGPFSQFYNRDDMKTPGNIDIISRARSWAGRFGFEIGVVGEIISSGADAGASVLVIDKSNNIGDEVVLIPKANLKRWFPDPSLEKSLYGVDTPVRPGQMIAFSRVIDKSGDPSSTKSGLRVASLEAPPVFDGAVIVMEASTGKVLAMVGGISYEMSSFNRATQAMRQPGSSIKPFIYLAHLERGGSINDTVLDAPVTVRVGNQVWKPGNASGAFGGEMPAWKALALSRNMPTVRLGMEIGGDVISEVWKRFGIYDDRKFMPSYLLGARETTLYRMVAAYGALANGGDRVWPTVVDKIIHRDGRIIYKAPEAPSDEKSNDSSVTGVSTVQNNKSVANGDSDENSPGPIDVFANEYSHPGTGQDRSVALPAEDNSPTPTAGITEMLRLAVTSGTAARAFSDLKIDFAGKTGTSNEARDTWFLGYTKDLVFGCFIGRDDFRPMGPGAYGGTLCAPLVASIAQQWFSDKDPGNFPPYEAPSRRDYSSDAVDVWGVGPDGYNNSAPGSFFGSPSPSSIESPFATPGGLY